MANQKDWDILTEMTKRQYFYAKDPRVPEDYFPARGKRVPQADTIEWMLREQARLTERLKILDFKIRIIQHADSQKNEQK